MKALHATAVLTQTTGFIWMAEIFCDDNMGQPDATYWQIPFESDAEFEARIATKVVEDFGTENLVITR